MPPTKTKLTWANIDPRNLDELEALRAQEHAEAIRRVGKAVADLQHKGILDAGGRRIRKDLPAEMQEESGYDLSAL